MRWKNEANLARRVTDAVAEAPDQETDLRERIRADLEARGVEASTAEVLAEHVRVELQRSPDGYAAVLDGVVLGFRVQDTVAQQLEKNASELQEIERLMGSFASELSKLDEVLEVLAAYLRRLRTATPSAASRILH